MNIKEISQTLEKHQTMLKTFKTVLTIRFLGYFFFIGGLITVFFILGPLIQVEIQYRVDKINGIRRTIFFNNKQNSSLGSSFETIKPPELSIIPASTEYGIVIEKINANAKIIPDVDPSKESAYSKALSEGVAEALGSTKPGISGNLYLFSHSTDAPWNIIRYNAVFYLLRKLEAGDRVVIFYKNRRYDYVVFDKHVVSPNDITYLTNIYDSPVLTMQTCDPPGTLINRLIVRAKLVSN